MGMLDSVSASHDVGNVHATQHPGDAKKQEQRWIKQREQTATEPFLLPCIITPPLEISRPPQVCPADAATIEVLEPLPRPARRRLMGLDNGSRNGAA